MGSKEDRRVRKDRNKTLSTRKPNLGYYLIVTDTKKTEKNYFKGLRNTIPEKRPNQSDRIRDQVRNEHTNTQ